MPPEVLTLLWDAVPLGICLLAAEQDGCFRQSHRRSSSSGDPRRTVRDKRYRTSSVSAVDLSDSLRATGIVETGGRAASPPPARRRELSESDAGNSTVIEWQHLRLSGIPSVATLMTLRDVSREVELEKGP